MAIINLNEYTSGDFITIKECPSLIKNNETITFVNFDIQSFKIWITSDNNDIFGPCESGCHFKTGTGLISKTGRRCKIIVVDLRDKSFSQRISNIVRRYIVEDGITQTVSFNINIEICYRLNAVMDNSQRFSAIEELVYDTVKGKRINTHEIEKKIIECLEEFFPDYINKKVDECYGINSFSQLSSLIINVKNECHQLKKQLSKEITNEISQMFSCVSIEVKGLDIIIPEEAAIEMQANRFAELKRTIREDEIKAETTLKRTTREDEIKAETTLKITARTKMIELLCDYIEKQISLPQDQIAMIGRIYEAALANDADISQLPLLLTELQKIDTVSPNNLIEMSKMLTTQLGLDEGDDK